MDCMEALKEYPYKYFELAIVDPPYGGAGGKVERRGGTWSAKYGKKGAVPWDLAPGQEYFSELFRVSQNQIIWGGNYFSLPPTRCFVVWRKPCISENFTMAMIEYAWTSFNQNAKIFDYQPMGTTEDPRFHPTQKPVELYRWLLSKYAKPGDKILDTHVGSASSLIACREMGFEYTGFEINEGYYREASERLAKAENQITMFDVMKGE